MNVLFVTYPHIGLNEGGLRIQIRETYEALIHLGVTVKLFDPWSYEKPSGVDICHVFSLDPSGLAYAQHYKKMGAKVVVSSVFNITSRTDRLFGIKSKLSNFAPGFYGNISSSSKLLSIASNVICLTDEEKSSLVKYFKVPPGKVTIIPNGVSERFFNSNPTIFRRRFGDKKFVLQVGAIEPNKNQLCTIKACKEAGIDLVLIGAANPNYQAYFDRCRLTADESVTFLGHVDRNDELLYSAYAAASAMAVPSFREVMPLVLLEAYAAGLPMLVSNTVPVPSHCMPGLIGRCSPKNSRSMSQLLTTFEYGRLQVDKFTTWPNVANDILNIYNV